MFAKMFHCPKQVTWPCPESVGGHYLRAWVKEQYLQQSTTQTVEKQVLNEE